jgi:hypothetical protein
MKKRMFAPLGALVLGIAIALLIAGPVSANPPGVTSGGKKLANFNLIMHPHTWDDLGNSCNGSRIFYAQDSPTWTLEWDFIPDLNPSFQISDCNATSDGSGVISEDAGVPVDIYLRVLGPVTSSLGVVCQDIVDLNNVNECLIDSATLSHSKSFTKITSHLADTIFSEVLWTLDPSTNFKIAQVDVYRQ